MDFLTADIKKLYRKYLFASLSGAVVTSIYAFIDTIAVGQAEGPAGSAAMAVISPVFSISTFVGMLAGIGGSVLMTTAKGEGAEEKGNAYFSASLLLLFLLTAVLWLAFLLFPKSIFMFFGADESLIGLVLSYAKWIVWFFPMFTAIIYLSIVLRNDGAPTLVTASMIFGGCFNAFGDWFFVFPMGMGIEGAGIATVLGTSLQVLLMCTHFLRKRCGLRFVRPFSLTRALRKIIALGFSTSVLDLGVMVLNILINNQIMRYGNETALAVYGVMLTLAALLQLLFCGVGQAIQPIVSANYGAEQLGRIRALWRRSLVTTLIMQLLFTAFCFFFPTQTVRIFMAATPEALAAAPGIFRPYSLAFLSLGLTVLVTYYLQAMKYGRASMIFSLARSVLVSGLLILLLPLWLGITGVWVAIPLAEMLVAIPALAYVARIHRRDFVA